MCTYMYMCVCEVREREREREIIFNNNSKRVGMFLKTVTKIKM